MKPELSHIANIECITVKGEGASTAVVFLHGYGANMHDLFPLWELWHQERFDWYFPNGLQSLPMGHYEGRSWFSIDMARLEVAMRAGTHRDMSQEVPVEFDETLKSLEVFILELKKKYKKIILGGFSQGAMCSAHLATHSGISLDGLILLSGNLIAEQRFPEAAKSVPFYQSHGSADPILSLEGAKALEAKLKALGFQGKLSVFRGGHEIPTSVIQEVKTYLAQYAE